MIDYWIWTAQLVVAAVFALSAWGKLSDRPAARKAVGEFGVPSGWVPAVAWSVPALEAVTAAALLLPATAPWAGLVALALLTVFTGAVVRLLARGERPGCSCFGAASADPVGATTLVRNGVLIAIAGFTVWGAAARPRVPQSLPADHAIGLAVLAASSTWLFWTNSQVRQLRRQFDRQALSTLGAEGLPVGAVAPEFELSDARGGVTATADLVAAGSPVLLVFVHPECEICAVLAGELPRWQRRLAGRLTIVVLANGDLEQNVAWGRARGLGEVVLLVQQGNEASLRYRVRGTPSAVLIGADGRIAAPLARGPMAIRELFITAKSGTP